MRTKIGALEEAFTGHFTDHHAYLLGKMVARVEAIAAHTITVVAVGRSILTIVWHLLSNPDARFHDLGAGFYDTRIKPDRKKRTHVRQLEALGYRVILEPAA
ncbi:hypothetical protein AB0K18_24430 [Nonomuraea sp. NPDC049421]|uniref:hypothetical protein n=1 Tax=Nonomuraea sp. NPDC049421 TaxID=3155275 RepID=UPI003421F627